MYDYIIATSSTADLPRTWLAQHAIPFISYSYTVGDKLFEDDCREESRQAVYEGMRKGDRLKTSGDGMLTDLQENYVEDLRNSIAHMAGWQRYRVKRMVEMYPQIRGIFSRTREEIMEVADISSLLGKLQFLRMDLETFFSQEKNEMY